MSDGVHLAVAIARRDGRGFVVAHRPGQDVAAREAFVSANLPAASAMTLAWTLALLGIITYLVESRVHDRFARNREQRDAASLRRMQSLVRTRDAVVFGLAKLAESRDPETGDHLERIGIYSSTLAEALRHVPRYANEVNQSFVRLIRVVSVLHDIGKVGVPDSILLKPGALSKEERSEMQRHTSVGGECIREIEQRLGSSNFLEMAREIAFAHHEQWDGSGYPLGLVGEEIPLSARIVAIVDVYDALASRRVYKTAMPHEECLARIRLGAGTQFDPKLLDVWLSIESQFKAIAIQYAWDRSAYSDPPSPATPRKADHAIGTARES